MPPASSIFRFDFFCIDYSIFCFIGYILADSGYDVWLGNFRGNIYSRGHVHVTKDPRHQPFWDFTVDELGKYELYSLNRRY